MLVTAITEVTKKKVKVEFDYRFTLVLYRGELNSFHLREQAEVSEELISEIEQKVLNKRAVKYAMHLLQKRDYTVKELTDKLLRAGYSEGCAAHALAYVSSYGYVDDRKYAIRYLETYSDRKSMKKMQMELRQKGVPEEIFAEAANEADTVDEKATLRYYAEKKARSLDLSQEKDRQKLLRFLVGRGFSFSAAKDVMEDIAIIQNEAFGE